LSQEVQVADYHAGHEHGEEGAIDDVHEIVHQCCFSSKSKVASATGQSHERSVDDDRTAEFDGNRPSVKVIGEPYLSSSSKNEGEVLEFTIPVP